jgi:predicted pyridoxine 5'-phosphate oxidase superfamily flavin-nucleotide-binding protein
VALRNDKPVFAPSALRRGRPVFAPSALRRGRPAFAWRFGTTSPCSRLRRFGAASPRSRLALRRGKPAFAFGRFGAATRSIRRAAVDRLAAGATIAAHMTFGSLVFTPVVKTLQERYGSRRQYEAMERASPSHQQFGPMESTFLAERDSFYWATLGSTGWPYVQHRGGPKGFLKVIDNRTLALADFRGNKQYVSTGNLLTDNRVAMIMVDYPAQARLKLLGRVDVLEGDAAREWIPRVRMPGYKAVIERVFVIHVEAFDWNCPQHITPRYTAEEIQEAVLPMEERLRTLELENATLRAEVDRLRKA